MRRARPAAELPADSIARQRVATVADRVRRGWSGGRTRPAAAVVVFGGGLAALAAMVLVHIGQGQGDLTYPAIIQALVAPDDSLQSAVVRTVRLPRAAVGVIAGAALAVSGVLLQAVTRNALAEASTLGITAGAYFAVTLGVVFAPAILAVEPLLAASAGGLLAVALVYVVTASVGITPLRLILAGVAVTLTLAAMTGALQLFFENRVAGLFLWGSGSLLQSDWGGTLYAAPRVAVGIGLALVMARAMDVLLLGDDTARALGQRVQLTRLAGIGVAVLLAATSVSVVGPIGFVGLIVPNVIRLVGLRRHLALLPACAIWGGALLVGADVFARLVSSNVSTNIGELPAGAVTALIGAPALVILAGKLSRTDEAVPHTSEQALRAGGGRTPPYPIVLAIAVAGLGMVTIAGLLLGDVRLEIGQVLAVLRGEGTSFDARIVLDFRLPRLLVAILAGSSLAVSGLLLQGVIRNPLASPEFTGIIAGAGLGALIVLILVPSAPIEAVPVAAFVGAFVAFGVVYLASWRGGLSTVRLALVGVAVFAFAAAANNVLIVLAKLRVAQAIVWLSGSTYARGWDEVLRLSVFPLVLLPIAWVAARWLDYLALGDDLPRSLGIPLERARLLLIVLAVALAAAAVATVGTISFVGLLAPHTARLLLGSRHRRLLPLTAVLGAILVVVADVVGRTLLAPKEIPSGLVTAIIGTPYFLWLLWRSRSAAAH